MSGFEDDPTPPKGKFRPPTADERRTHAAQWDSSHKGVVRGEFDDEETSPIDLFDRDPKDAEERIIRHLRRDPKRLIEYVGKIAAKAQHLSTEFRRRVVHETSENQRQLEELRDLLNKPPNGALRHVEERVEEIEGTIKGVRAFSKWAIGGLITAVLGGATGIVATMQAKAKEEGARDERIITIQRDIIELKARLNNRSQRPGYDYDISPRPEPPKDSK